MSTLDEAKLKKFLDEFFSSKSQEYGDYTETFKTVTTIFNMLTGQNITPKQGVLFMVILKLYREGFKHKNDSVVDAIGYLRMLIEPTETSIGFENIDSYE